MESMPRVALGTYLSLDEKPLKEAVRVAFEEGNYKHIDCAWVYGNEKWIGEALKDLFDRKVIKREEIWITSKVWNTMHKPELVERSCRETLRDLQVDYLDLLLMHFPASFLGDENGKEILDEKGFPILDHVPIVDTWKAMERLVEKGLVRHIGVSNFSIEMLERLRYLPEIKIQPYTNQVEMNLFMQQPILLSYLVSRGISLMAYSPFAMGTDMMFKNETVKRIAEETGKTMAQVALRYLLNVDEHVIVLPKSVTPERVISNNQLDFQLTEKQMNDLRGLERCYRTADIREKWNCDLHAIGW